MLTRSLLVLVSLAGCSPAPALDPPFPTPDYGAAGLAPQIQSKAQRERAALAGFDFEAKDLGLGLGSASERAAAEQELLHAREHQRGNEHLHALERFAAAARMAPDWAPALAGLASGLMAVRQEHKALRVFERALALAPDDLEVKFDQGDLLLRMGQREQARASFLAVIEAQPDHARAHGRLARLAYLAGDLQGAQSSAQLAIDGGEALPARLIALVAREAPR